MIKIRLKLNTILGRTDIKKPTWFAMDNSILTHANHFQKINPKILISYVYFCAEMSKIKKSELVVNLSHALFFTTLSESDFFEACEKLNELQLLEVIRTDSVRDPIGLRTDSVHDTNGICALQSREEKGRENTYGLRTEKTEEFIYKQEGVKNYETLPELISLKEIFLEKKIERRIQEKWLKLYHPALILREVLKADSYASAKKKEYKNWASYFNNWLMRSASDRKHNSPQEPSSLKAKEEPPRKIHPWAEAQEKLIAEKNGGAQ